MAVVLLARDTKHDRPVAIKVLSPELTDAIGVQRFQREIEVVAGLNHPNILPLHDSGEAGGFAYYVMPYLASGSLRHRIEREGRLPQGDAVRIVREIADALGFAHRNGIIHRDVKPGNILLSEGHALLADFGIAHLATGATETLTGEGLALGTPAYLSPEQASGSTDVDGRSDIYSLGCVLFEALTGRPPFSEASVRTLLMHHIVEPPPRVRSLRPDLSPTVDAVVETALQKDPSARFQTGEQMAGAIDLVTGSLKGFPAIVLRRFGVSRRHVRRVRQSFAILTLLAVAGAAFGIRAWIERYDGPPRAEVRYLVLPFEGQDATDAERALSRVAASELREQLSGWNSVSVVREPALEGPTTELQVAGIQLTTLAFGTSLARRLDADFIVYVAATRMRDVSAILGRATDSGDSLEVTATIYVPDDDVEHDHLRAVGVLQELGTITAGIALELLGIHGEAAEIKSLIARSPNHRAHQEFQRGREALWAWRLAEAHRLFEAALERDPDFALAHHLLAETMYWEMSADEERLLELGPIIEYHSRTADRSGTNDRLRPGERRAVNAFRAFWTGDYDLARARYDTLLAFERFDLESLVLRGAVEFEDPMLVVGEDGSLRPRQNLNVARAVFDTATVLSSRWELSWGHLHAIDRKVAETAYMGWCYGFEPPGLELVPPYEIRDAVEQEYFCPIVEADTIRWELSDEILPPGDQASIEAAAAIHRRSVALLNRWASVERDQPRHYEELAKFLLWERQTLRCDADLVRADSLLELARGHFDRALEMRGDTTPQNRLTLASLYLGSGDLDAALAESDRALEEMTGWESQDRAPPAIAAANTYLAAGLAHPAVDILERVWGENTMGFLDPLDPNRTIDSADMYATLNAIEMLGFLGISGPDVARRFDILHRAWRDAPLSERDRVALRLASLSYVGPALVHSPDEWEEWFDGWDEHGLKLPAIWKGLLAAGENPADTAEARVRLEEALGALDRKPFGRPIRPAQIYLPTLLAERIGADSIAAELRDRLAGCVLRLESLDPGWAIQYSLGIERAEGGTLQSIRRGLQLESR